MGRSRKAVECEAGFACLQCGAKFATLQALGGHKSVHSNKRKAAPSRKNSPPPDAMAAERVATTSDSFLQRAKRGRRSHDQVLNGRDTEFQTQQWLRGFAAASLYQQAFNAGHQGSTAPAQPLALQYLSAPAAKLGSLTDPCSSLAFSRPTVNSLTTPDFGTNFAVASTSLPSSVRSGLGDVSTSSHQVSSKGASAEGAPHSPEITSANGSLGGAHGAGFFLEAAARRLRVMAQPVEPLDHKSLVQRRQVSLSPRKPTSPSLMPALKKVEPNKSFDDECGSMSSSDDRQQALMPEGCIFPLRRKGELDFMLSSVGGPAVGTTDLLLELGSCSSLASRQASPCTFDGAVSVAPRAMEGMDLTLRLSLP